MSLYKKTIINSLTELDEYTKQFVTLLKPGRFCLLRGEMGVGKTTFVSSVLKHFSFYDVSSPSYTIVQEYESVPPVYHIDLYRLDNIKDTELLDLDYYFSQKSHVKFIEWPDHLQHFDYSYLEIILTRKQDQRFIVLKEN